MLSFRLFADDTYIYIYIYCSHKNLNDLELILNQDLYAVAEWIKSNRLALSILKTNFVLFHSKKLKLYKSLNLKIDGVNIQEVSAVKYLGVTFDSNLTWKNYVNELCLRLSKTGRHIFEIKVLRYTYYALLFPNLPLSYLWYLGLGSHIPNLPKTSNYFAKTKSLD